MGALLLLRSPVSDHSTGNCVVARRSIASEHPLHDFTTMPAQSKNGAGTPAMDSSPRPPGFSAASGSRSSTIVARETLS